MRRINSFWRRPLPLALALVLILAAAVPAFAATSVPAGTLIPASQAAAAATVAQGTVGDPYRFGGESPSTGFDSSGLAQWAYAQEGVAIPRVVRQQVTAGTAVDKAALLPGDLVFFDFNGDGTADKTGVYLGSNQFVIAVSGGVMLRSFAWPFYQSHYVGARRVVPAAVQETLGQQVVDKAETYIGIPYQFGATGPNAYDCSGFTQAVFRQFGVNLPRVSSQQATVGQAVAKGDLQPGDLVFFQNTWRTGVDHVGIYIGGGKFINAWPSTGVTISDMTRPYFVAHYWGARRVLPQQ